MIADVMDTPHTDPSDRIKYTVDADTAWSWRAKTNQKPGMDGGRSMVLPACSNVASDVKRSPGNIRPCPTFAGKTYTKYFQAESWNRNDATSPLPTTIKRAPTRTRPRSCPHRDMTMPAISPPMGTPKEGMTIRAPATVGESSRTTWKYSGRAKRYYRKRDIRQDVSEARSGRVRLTAYAAVPPQTLATCVNTGSFPRSIRSGIMGIALVRPSTRMKSPKRARLAPNAPNTHGLLQGRSLPPRLSPRSCKETAATRSSAPEKSTALHGSAAVDLSTN